MPCTYPKTELTEISTESILVKWKSGCLTEQVGRLIDILVRVLRPRLVLLASQAGASLDYNHS